MTNVCVITKHNIVTSTIGVVFLITRSDVPHPRHTTTESCEHVLSNARRYNREATVQKFVEMVEKLVTEGTAMYESNFVRRRIASNGYGSIYKDFLFTTMDCSASLGTEYIIFLNDQALSNSSYLVRIRQNTCTYILNFYMIQFKKLIDYRV